MSLLFPLLNNFLFAYLARVEYIFASTAHQMTSHLFSFFLFFFDKSKLARSFFFFGLVMSPNVAVVLSCSKRPKFWYDIGHPVPVCCPFMFVPIDDVINVLCIYYNFCWQYDDDDQLETSN